MFCVQEAFKAVEDIHGFITLSKKQPKPALMANYLQKLGLVFAKSGKYLFHASTLHRLFVLSREQRRNMSQDELQRLVCVLVFTIVFSCDAAGSAVAFSLDCVTWRVGQDDWTVWCNAWAGWLTEWCAPRSLHRSPCHATLWTTCWRPTTVDWRSAGGWRHC